MRVRQWPVSRIDSRIRRDLVRNRLRPGILAGVRKQYHLRPADEGFDAWDVDRLVDMAADLPVVEVALSGIREIDTDYWFQDPLQPPTVRSVVDHARLIQDADLSWPIILDPGGRVLDGMHRVGKALLEGRSAIGAVRLEVLPEPDYRNCRPEDLPYDRG